MGLYSFYRISKPSGERVSPDKVGSTYKSLRNKTFWGATAAYSLFYLCRLSMGVVKKPLIDEGLFSASELGVIASAFYFVYAIGKFVNGFIADYCNVRRYMATGLTISSAINLLMGIIGLGSGYVGFPPYGVPDLHSSVGNKRMGVVDGFSFRHCESVQVVPSEPQRYFLQHILFYTLRR